MAGTVSPETEKLLAPALAVSTGVEPVQPVLVIETGDVILRLVSNTSVKEVLVMSVAVGLLKNTFRLLVPPWVMVVDVKLCDTDIDALAVAAAEAALGLLNELALMSVAVTAVLACSVLVKTSPTLAAAGMVALRVIVQVPAEVPLPAATVPPVQVAEEAPAPAESALPPQPAPKLPEESTIWLPATRGRLSVKLTLLSAPADQLVIVMV